MFEAVKGRQMIILPPIVNETIPKFFFTKLPGKEIMFDKVLEKEQIP